MANIVDEMEAAIRKKCPGCPVRGKAGELVEYIDVPRKTDAWGTARLHEKEMLLEARFQASAGFETEEQGNDALARARKALPPETMRGIFTGFSMEEGEGPHLDRRFFTTVDCKGTVAIPGTSNVKEAMKMMLAVMDDVDRRCAAPASRALHVHDV
jgi:hypothetical protein